MNASTGSLTKTAAFAGPVLTIFDLEFTAWECSMASHWLRPGEFKEVVQIGAVRVDPLRFTVLDSFQVLVRPRINARLSTYLTQLTGITQSRLDAEGVDFAAAYGRFVDFCAGGPIAAFGHDEWVLQDNVRLYGIGGVAPLPAFTDLRGWFAARGLDPRGLCSCDIAPALGVAFEGQAHDALADARAIAAGMAVLAARGTAVAA